MAIVVSQLASPGVLPLLVHAVDSGIASERHRLCNGASMGLHRSDMLFAREQALLQWSSVENGHLFGCSKRESQAHLCVQRLVLGKGEAASPGETRRRNT